MDETQYHSMYRSINQRKCVFEKTINARRASCSCAKRFNLADREGVACESASGYEHCLELLEQLRKNSSFALHVAHIDGPLPHSNELKVQAGGLLGLKEVTQKENPAVTNTDDIHALLNVAKQQFKQIENFPYTEIVKSINNFKGRQRRK
ncbi:hypothetical protein MNBD_GAMMA25-1296 [hydrothermal vent metagenome]|uniref:Uncharacterized protein n=1 Tax=hydrothermal vent metagenome TaxID=652676 RepID=A0A3B1BYY8_9ZZZZ